MTVYLKKTKWKRSALYKKLLMHYCSSFRVFAQKLSVDEQIVPQFWRHAVKRFSQRQKKGIDVPHPHYFMRCNQGMGGVDLLNCFISQYKPTIHPKKWCYPLLLNYINMICVAAWQLYVIFQRNP